MKMIKRILPAAAALLLLTSCGDTSKVDSLISRSEKAATSAPEASSSQSDSATQTDVSLPDTASGDVDIDLTVLDSNMVYAQVFDMVNNTDNYKGKTVKAKGSFAHTTDDTGSKDYYAVFISDASACCQQGLEFERNGEFKYPDDFPEVGADITVTGEFDTYMEGDYQYCVLRNAQMTKG